MVKCQVIDDAGHWPYKGHCIVIFSNQLITGSRVHTTSAELYDVLDKETAALVVTGIWQKLVDLELEEDFPEDENIKNMTRWQHHSWCGPLPLPTLDVATDPFSDNPAKVNKTKGCALLCKTIKTVVN